MATTLNYRSLPVFLTGQFMNAYTCPAAKKALVKAIVCINESPSSGRLSVLWNDANNIGAGSTSTYFPILISGAVDGYGRVRVIDEFLALNAGDVIHARHYNTGQFNLLLSIVEQPASL